MDLYNALPETDRENIFNYLEWNSINCDATYPRREKLPKILHYWAQEKVDLYKMFDENFILSKRIKVPFVTDIAINQCYRDDTINHFKNNLQFFFQRMNDEFQGYCSYTNGFFSTCHGFENSLWISNPGDFKRACEAIDEVPDRVYNLIGWIIPDFETLVTNKIDWHDDYHSVKIPYGTDGDYIKISKGDKTMKALGKIIHTIFPDLVDEFEEFRIRVSQITNQSSLSGDLCISIHPLDFMTMSDNSSNWSSCMNWRNKGEYRCGTVEMMNSCSVVVAYLKSDTETLTRKNCKWNSKKWRSLFIVTNGAIVSVKGYPYQNETLTKTVLEWLKELYDKNLVGTWFDPLVDTLGNPCELHMLTDDELDMFKTDNMYNDFGTTDHYGYITPAFMRMDEYNYSGILNCMSCGEMWDADRYDARLCKVNCDDCLPIDEDEDYDDEDYQWDEYECENILADDAITINVFKKKSSIDDPTAYHYADTMIVTNYDNISWNDDGREGTLGGMKIISKLWSYYLCLDNQPWDKITTRARQLLCEKMGPAIITEYMNKYSEEPHSDNE